MVPLCWKCYTIAQDPFKQHEVAPNKTENITQKKILNALKTKWKAAVRRHAISGVSFFPVSSQRTGTGLDTSRERKRDYKLTTVVKTYSPGHLGLQLNADTPVIPMYSMCTVYIYQCQIILVFSVQEQGNFLLFNSKATSQ